MESFKSLSISEVMALAFDMLNSKEIRASCGAVDVGLRGSDPSADMQDP